MTGGWIFLANSNSFLLSMIPSMSLFMQDWTAFFIPCPVSHISIDWHEC